MTLLVESALKVAVLLVVALAVATCCRRRSAALRHWVLAAAVMSSLCVPVLMTVVPQLRIEMEAPRLLSRPVAPAATFQERPAPDAPDAANEADSAGAASFDFIRAGAVVWALGAALGILTLSVGLARLALLAREARPLRDRRWAAIAEEVGRSLDLRQSVTLLQGDSSQMLMTWGIASPKVLVPHGADAWPHARVRIVLAHELAHVRRGDWFVQIAAECLRILYWFNPLVWLACRSLRRESEYACDDAVLSMGIDGTEYAAELVEFARHAGKRRGSWLPAPAMAHTSSLERRVTAMLNTTLNRVPPRRAARWSVGAAGLVVAAAVTALTVSAQTFSSLSGSIFDATNRVLPNVEMRLTNAQTGAEYRIRSDSTGRYQFVGLPPGEYALQALLPGFSVLRGTVQMTGQHATQDARLDVGSLEETLTIVDGLPPAAPRPPAAPPAFTSKPCEPKSVGGNIRPPAKLGDARPIYPVAYRNSGHAETVVLQAVIDRDGMIREVNPVGSPTPDFANAGVEAVRQWKFSPTLLNCEATEVNMTVTLRFNAAPPLPPPPPPAPQASAAGVAHLRFEIPGVAKPVLKLRSGEPGSLVLGDGWRYDVTATVRDGAKDSVELFISGQNPSGQRFDTVVMARKGELIAATGHAPFSISLLDIAR